MKKDSLPIAEEYKAFPDTVEDLPNEESAAFIKKATRSRKKEIKKKVTIDEQEFHVLKKYKNAEAYARMDFANHFDCDQILSTRLLRRQSDRHNIVLVKYQVKH